VDEVEGTDNACIFCNIANREIPAEIIYEDEMILSFLDIEPINEGHILIIPKKHFLDLDEIDEDTAVHIMKFAARITSVLKRMYKPDGYSIMQNGGYFNDVGHYHMHVFPRYKDDGFGWTYGAGAGNSKDLSVVKNSIIFEMKESAK
jgi:diadenosine tetraphosphate (Ap4A) HIT family hydrolase